ncbi:MAG TPA: serine/threonine-protein kinase [Chloroflexota bacterium]|jgi:serine/threonine-protein kinase
MMAQLVAGQTIDARYVLRGQLGRGGMASVYEAFDPKLDLPVVLKILPRQLAHDPTFVVRFRREGRTLARLTHPHVVRLYELGEDEDEGLYYLVLEYLRGGTLKARQGRTPWSIDRVAEIMRPVALAVDFAHRQERPVVHRDLKPANIMFGEHDRVVVSDFGLADMLASDETRQSQTTWGSITAGAVLGTPAYMAPEQAEGKATGPAADRYALGVVAYELLVGAVPFLADTPQATLIQVLTKPLPLPSHLNPRIGRTVEDVLLKALARDPSLRFSSAIEFVESLEDAGRLTAPVVMPPAPEPRSAPIEDEPPPPLPVRRPAGLLAAGGVLVALAVGAAALLFAQALGERDALQTLAQPTALVAPRPEPTRAPTEGPLQASTLQVVVVATPTPVPTLEPTVAPATPEPTPQPEPEPAIVPEEEPAPAAQPIGHVVVPTAVRRTAPVVPQAPAPTPTKAAFLPPPAPAQATPPKAPFKPPAGP